ncbi:MAG: sensor histidine kinase [Bacteroidales bacterium]
MLNNFQRYLLTWHPFLISIILFLAVVIFFPFEWNEYRVEEKKHEEATPGKLDVYEDLNGDGQSEQVRFLNFQNPNISSVRVYNNNGILEQWNFDGSTRKRNFTYFIGDYNDNSKKEIYFFTFRNDSTFLHIIEPFSREPIIRRDRFIAHHTTERTKYPDCNIHKGGFVDLNSDDKAELYFTITAGYNKQPRRAFIYDIRNDSLKVSPKGGISMYNMRHFFMNNDSIIALTVNTRAHGNHSSDFPYTDQKGWLMVFKPNLDFHFEPVSFDEYPMKLYVEPFKYEDNDYLFVFRKYFGSKNIPCALFIYNMDGELVQKRELKRKNHSRNSGILTIDNQLYGISGEGDVHRLDFELNTKKKWTIGGIIKGKPVFKADLDNDNKDEFIFKGRKDDEFIITNENLKHPVSFHAPYDTLMHPHFSIITDESGKRSFYAESDKIIAQYTYEKNIFYEFRYLIYVIGFGVLWCIVWLFSQLQNRLVRQKYEMQQKISELQLKSIKNHIEPHFTFNLLNSISALVHKGDNNKANEMIGKYSKLLRQSVVNSDKTIVPLSEEINYVRHYLEIERYRYNYKFDYTIDTRDEAALNITVPKMFLQIFVENAVRHGIKHLKNNGLIKILVAKVQSTYQIEILDNGIGREKAAEYSVNSTKSGLSSIEKIRKYHNQHTKNQKITYEIRDLKEGEENPGTHVIIKIKRCVRKKNFTG